MSTILKVNDETISSEQFIKILKLTNELPELLENLIKDKVTVHEAKKRGITVSTEEVQKAVDEYRRYAGLHRAKDTQEWLDEQGLNLDEFEDFMSERLYKRKMTASITTDDAIEEYFKLNSPRFEKVDIKQIIVESEAQAKEIMAMIADNPNDFDKYCSEHSLDDETSASGGLETGVRRGKLPDEVDAKVFNAKVGDVIGPFQFGGENLWQVVMVAAVHPPKKDDDTENEIADAIYEDWLDARMKENTISG
jgi:parvulin-like peptidyl-prolyl isomerase